VVRALPNFPANTMATTAPTTRLAFPQTSHILVCSRACCMKLRVASLANSSASRIATRLRLPLRQARPSVSRQSYRDVYHYSTHAQSLFQTHIPPHKRARSGYLQSPISTWEKFLQETSNPVDTMTNAMSVTSNTSSGKRKRAGPKFYAVREGRIPGIYHSWEDCKAQTDGVKAACRAVQPVGYGTI
jgi:hypothetical protein